MNKLYAVLGIIFLFIFQQLAIFNVKASDAQIIYLYSDENKIEQNVFEDITSRDIEVKEINVSKLDNMKYFYLYQKAYDISIEEFTEPIIISGDYYYIGEEITNNLQDIYNNAFGELRSINDVNLRMIVYFKSSYCEECIRTEQYILDLEKTGIKVVWVYTDGVENDNRQLLLNYGEVYGVDNVTVPIVFAGDKYYHTQEGIKNNLEDIIVNSEKLLLNVEFNKLNTNKYEGLMGYLFVIIGGLIDGVNPCAMAMLILFIGLLLGSNAKKSTLINISIAYILGLFITYFALGLFLMEFIQKIEPYIKNLSTYINIFVIIFSLFFFLFNLYDYFVSKNKKYQKIKNQLPKRIQKFNKKIIKFFTTKLNNKSLIIVYLFSFILAVIITFTEFLCTGQVYLPIILIIKDTGGTEGVLKLLIYNFMFIVPLTILAIIAIKAKSAIETSNIVREKIHIIKLLTSILFLGIAIYYLLIVIGVI